MKTETVDLDVRLIPFIINKEIRGVSAKATYGVEMIKAKSIWPEAQKGAGVRIAVIDSGCDINHESLKNNIAGVRNFTDEDKKNPNIVVDRVGHGTHVIGTICANGSNITGVAPGAQIYVLKAINRTGTGKLSWVVNAIKYAIELKVDIISMSLGISENSAKLEKAIKVKLEQELGYEVVVK